MSDHVAQDPPSPESPQPQFLVDFLVRQFPSAKKTTLKRMVESRRVRINGKPATKLKQPIAPTDTIEVGDHPKAPEASLHPMKLVHEDEDVLVIEKPAGLLTSTVPREPRPTAIAMIREYLKEREPRSRAGVIHRLDADASGLLVFSKNNDAFEALKNQFFHHTVKRVYQAIVEGVLKEPKGRIESRLDEHADGTVHTTRHPDKGQPAVTHYELLKTHTPAEGAPMSLLRVTLETGRKHQIRAHLAEQGHPILGDPLYAAGGKRRRKADAVPKKIHRLMLAATELSFTHPRTGKEMSFTIPAPKEFARLLG